MLQQVGKTGLESFEILFVEIGLGNAAMVLKRANGGNNDDGIGLQIRKAAFDVEELLGTKVCAEAGLSDAVIAQSHSHASRHDGVAAVSDVCEGAAMHECGGSFERLYEIGLRASLSNAVMAPSAFS